MKRQLKKSVVYGLYGLSFSLLVGGITMLGFATAKPKEASEEKYVSKGILDYEEQTKVVNTEVTLGRPYNNSEIKIVKNYYDYKAESENQEQSLIYYEGTYMPSSGVSYSLGEPFEVMAVLDGTVKEVKEDTLLGNIVTIEHDNGITSIYQSISDIKVKQGDKVSKGQVIATSSTSNISIDLNNHLYFELIVNGECKNPENYYDKSISELGA